MFFLKKISVFREKDAGKTSGRSIRSIMELAQLKKHANFLANFQLNEGGNDDVLVTLRLGARVGKTESFRRSINAQFKLMSRKVFHHNLNDAHKIKLEDSGRLDCENPSL